MARRRAIRGTGPWQPGPRPTGRMSGSTPPWFDTGARRLLALAIVVAGVAVGGWWLYASSFLSIQNVSVEGNTTLSAETVRSVAGLDDEKLLRPDFAAARERLMALPIVKDVAVSRHWPTGARISIVERTPWGIWLSGGQRYVIDEEGVVLDLPPPADAPVIVQTEALAEPLAAGARVDQGAIDVAKRLVNSSIQVLGRPVTALEFSQAHGLTVVLGDELRVRFGDAQDYDFKVAALFAIMERAAESGRTLNHVDLRFGDRVAVR